MIHGALPGVSEWYLWHQKVDWIKSEWRLGWKEGEAHREKVMKREYVGSMQGMQYDGFMQMTCLMPCSRWAIAALFQLPLLQT